GRTAFTAPGPLRTLLVLGHIALGPCPTRRCGANHRAAPLEPTWSARAPRRLPFERGAAPHQSSEALGGGARRCCTLLPYPLTGGMLTHVAYRYPQNPAPRPGGHRRCLPAPRPAGPNAGHGAALQRRGHGAGRAAARLAVPRGDRPPDWP